MCPHSASCPGRKERMTHGERAFSDPPVGERRVNEWWVEKTIEAGPTAHFNNPDISNWVRSRGIGRSGGGHTPRES
jgi:hypothetical protein